MPEAGENLKMCNLCLIHMSSHDNTADSSSSSSRLQLQQIHDAESRERKAVECPRWLPLEIGFRHLRRLPSETFRRTMTILWSSLDTISSPSSQSLASSSICCQACLARPSNHRVSRFVYLNIQAAHPSDLARVPAQYRALDCYSLDFGGDEDDHAL